MPFWSGLCVNTFGAKLKADTTEEAKKIIIEPEYI